MKALRPWNNRSKSQTWATPRWLFQECQDRFAGKTGFTLDAAANERNTKCPRFFSEAEDGLSQEWRGAVWCNPPYKDVDPWVVKAHNEVMSGRCRVAVLLVPVRADQCWFQFALKNAWFFEFVDGRVKFDPPPGVEPKTPFEASMVIVFQRPLSARGMKTK